MSLEHIGDIVSDGYIDGAGEFVPAAGWNGLVEVIDQQIFGALAAIGTGIIAGGVATAGSGLSVNLTAFSAIVQTSNFPVFIALPATVNVPSLAANSTLYLFAGANVVSGGGSSDSRNTGVVVLTTSTNSTPLTGQLPLVKIITGASSVTSVTDLRTYITSVQALTALQAWGDTLTPIETAIGWPYTGVLNLATRVTNLEEAAGGTSGSTAPTWGGMNETPTNTTTIAQFVAAQIASALAALPSSGGTATTPPAPWDIDAQNEETSLLARLQTEPLAEALAEYNSQVDALIYVPGVCGDGSNGTPDLRDEASTW
jgi:hypothetical protein